MSLKSSVQCLKNPQHYDLLILNQIFFLYPSNPKKEKKVKGN